MKEYLETFLDLGSWILAGAFFGLTALGGLYYYNATQNPDTPRKSFEPIREPETRQEESSRTFRSPEEFYLVREYSRTTEDTPGEPGQSSATGEEEPGEQPVNQPDEIVESDLPYKLVGTVTGGQHFQQAVVRSLRERETKTLHEGDSWKDFRVREIQDNRLLIVNETNNQVEKLSLNPETKKTR